MDSRKGLSVSAMFPIGLTVGIAVIGISIIVEVLVQLQSTQTTDGASYNMTASGVSAMAKFGTWFPIIITVVIAVIVIALLMYFKGRE